MKRKIVFLIGTALIVFALASASLAATDAFALSWWTVDGGGGASSGATYSLVGTIGQPDAGYEMSGGEYSLAGGFWGAGGAPPTPNPLDRRLYLPLVRQ